MELSEIHEQRHYANEVIVVGVMHAVSMFSFLLEGNLMRVSGNRSRPWI